MLKSSLISAGIVEETSLGEKSSLCSTISDRPRPEGVIIELFKITRELRLGISVVNVRYRTYLGVPTAFLA